MLVHNKHQNVVTVLNPRPIHPGLVTISQEAIEKTIRDMFPRAVKENIAALSKGRELAAGQ